MPGQGANDCLEDALEDNGRPITKVCYIFIDAAVLRAQVDTPYVTEGLEGQKIIGIQIDAVPLAATAVGQEIIPWSVTLVPNGYTTTAAIDTGGANADFQDPPEDTMLWGQFTSFLTQTGSQMITRYVSYPYDDAPFLDLNDDLVLHRVSSNAAAGASKYVWIIALFLQD